MVGNGGNGGGGVRVVGGGEEGAREEVATGGEAGSCVGAGIALGVFAVLVCQGEHGEEEVGGYGAGIECWVVEEGEEVRDMGEEEVAAFADM